MFDEPFCIMYPTYFILIPFNQGLEFVHVSVVETSFIKGTCLIIMMTNVVLDCFQQVNPPSFGGAHLSRSLTKSHNLNVYECTQKWGTTSL
jgi:hypothetical protein